MHGGTNPGRPMITGRYSLVHRAALAEKMQQFLADPHPGDLTEELALMRALLQDYLGRFPDGVALPLAGMEQLFGMIETVSRLVERIARIMSQHALTTAEVQLLQTRMADLLLRYIDDPEQRLQFLDELGATFDGGRRDAPARLTADASS